MAYVRHSIQGLALQPERTSGRQQPAGCQAHLPVCLVQLHDPLLQLPGLVRGEAELTDIVAHVFLCIVVTQLSLHSIGAQQGMRDEGAGQPACDDICPQLQAQVIPRHGKEVGMGLHLQVVQTLTAELPEPNKIIDVENGTHRHWHSC